METMNIFLSGSRSKDKQKGEQKGERKERESKRQKTKTKTRGGRRRRRRRKILWSKWLYENREKMKTLHSIYVYTGHGVVSCEMWLQADCGRENWRKPGEPGDGFPRWRGIRWSRGTPSLHSENHEGSKILTRRESIVLQHISPKSHHHSLPSSIHIFM